MRRPPITPLSALAPLVLLALAPAAGSPAPAPASSSVMLTSPAPPTALATLANGREIQAMIARARAAIRPDQPVLLQTLLRFAPYTSFLEYRRGPWPPALHDDIELFFVVQGSGTFVTGGTMPPGGGGAITGGTTRQVGAADFFVVPAHTPHGFPRVDGELVLISMHVPATNRPAP